MATDRFGDHVSEDVPDTHGSRANSYRLRLRPVSSLGGDIVADAAFAPVHTLGGEAARAANLARPGGRVRDRRDVILQLANVTATLLSVVCLLLMPGFLLMSHRGVDLVPLVLARWGGSPISRPAS